MEISLPRLRFLWQYTLHTYLNTQDYNRCTESLFEILIYLQSPCRVCSMVDTKNLLGLFWDSLIFFQQTIWLTGKSHFYIGKYISEVPAL